jgi:hypothetical protein
VNLLETLMDANGGAVVREMARGLGVEERQAQSGLEQLVPALARGLQRNASQPGGLDSLLGALKSGGHQRYLDHPEELAGRESITDGNAILSHILGSKDVSRNVAGRAARESGLESGLLEKMLPMVAAAAMGSLGKQTSGGGTLDALTGGSSNSSGVAGLLESFLDSDRDGAVIDDVLGLAKKFF